MSTITIENRESTRIAALWHRLWNSNRLLALSAAVYAVMFVAMLGLSIFDGREVVGAPVWFKPMKFALSGVLYTVTLAWMLGFVQRWRRLGRFVGGLTAVALFVEIGLIVFQAARGVPSHFNASTPFDEAVFSAMGLTILVVWAGNLLAAVLLAGQRMEDRPLAWAIRLALVVTAAGAALGMLMVRPTPDQLGQMQAGGAPALVGAHSVGVQDGGAGLPFTGWSTEGGDLRVPHFVGLHALQALPLAAVLINRFGRALNRRRRTALVWIAGLAYGGLIGLLTWQALRGQPLVAPDALTLAALGGLLGLTLAAGTAVVAPGKLRKQA